jgi:hypothetical protein
MTRRGEKPKIAKQHTLQPVNGNDKQMVMAVKTQIGAEGLRAKNVDKGFNRFIRHFRSLEPIAAALWVEDGPYGEFDWAGHMQQGSRRCLLAACVFRRTNEEATRAALATFANFEPIHGKARRYQAIVFFPEEFTLELAGTWAKFADVGHISRFAGFSEDRRNSSSDFAAGPNEFISQPTLLPVSEALPKHETCARGAAISRLRPVVDGLD